MLASTMQFSRYGRSRQPKSPRTPMRHLDPELSSGDATERGRSAGSRS
jgi:hypothetical protein